MLAREIQQIVKNDELALNYFVRWLFGAANSPYDKCGTRECDQLGGSRHATGPREVLLTQMFRTI